MGSCCYKGRWGVDDKHVETHLAAIGSALTPIAMHTDIGIAAGARFVANCASIGGVAGLNASVWIENSTGKVGVDDFDGAGEVWVETEVCAICTRRDRIAPEVASDNFAARQSIP